MVPGINPWGAGSRIGAEKRAGACPRGAGACPRGAGAYPRGAGACPRGAGACPRGAGACPRGLPPMVEIGGSNEPPISRSVAARG
uniref:Uncharacterized protein n=1 Tax=Leptobrachium leishanense TaxID=445787 RepID=A0A8C5MR54_9ANUR